jgi:hypothetical protein
VHSGNTRGWRGAEEALVLLCIKRTINARGALIKGDYTLLWSAA